MFTFKQGDRPLEGYTIQRAVGRGGFGEVYYAVSDGGKEVALKYLRENPSVELRGVAACLNLKSPHLVSIYDVRQASDLGWFVVMEYVAGTSLRDLMNSTPGGLGPQKAAYLIREIGKGLNYLHERGIVHRDLKPGNVFYDEGYVKIGDYGLSKFMTASQHSGQTVSVGTVHYMAPEIGSGNYDRTIDIYAMGVMLYEMVLGKVPFAGATVGEILMKHLTAQPEVDALPAPFPDVIRKALSKDPKDRYATVPEMIAALFSAAQIGREVAEFEPASLSVAAARASAEARVRGGVAAGGVAVGGGSSNVGHAFHSSDLPPVVDQRRFGNTPSPGAARVAAAAGRVGEAVQGALNAIDGPRREVPLFPPRSRLATGLLGVFLGALGIHRFYTGYNRIAIFQVIVTCFTGVGALWGMIEGVMILANGNYIDVYGRPLVSTAPRDRSLIGRLGFGLVGSLAMIGAVVTAIVATLTNDPDVRPTMAGSEIQFNMMNMLYFVSAGLVGLGSFGLWKSAHRGGYSFWRATVRAGGMSFLAALFLASLAFYLTMAFGRAEHVVSGVVMLVSSIVFVVFWHLRGPEASIVRDDLYWDLAWRRVFVLIGLAVAGASFVIGKAHRDDVRFLPIQNVRVVERYDGERISHAATTDEIAPTSGSTFLAVGLVMAISCFVEAGYRNRRLKLARTKYGADEVRA